MAISWLHQQVTIVTRIQKYIATFLSTYNQQGAEHKNSPILLCVKLHQYFQNPVACFKAKSILKKVWTGSWWDIFVLLSSVHINQHSLLGHTMFCYGVCKYYTLINRTLFGGKCLQSVHSMSFYGVCSNCTLHNWTLDDLTW